MTDPTPPTPLELARRIAANVYSNARDHDYASWIMDGRKDSDFTVQAALAALTSPQHRAGIRREALEEAARVIEGHATYGNQRAMTMLATAIRSLGEKPDA